MKDLQQKLLNKGFDIIIPKGVKSYFFFGSLTKKDNKVFYTGINEELSNEIYYSLKYKPSKKNGDGVRINKKDINKNVKELIPPFIDIKEIKFYNNLIDFMEFNKKFNIKYKIIKKVKK